MTNPIHDTVPPESPLGESEIDRKLREASERFRAERIAKYGEAGADEVPGLRARVQDAIRRRAGEREPQRVAEILAPVEILCTTCGKLFTIDRSIAAIFGTRCLECRATDLAARLAAFREREHAKLPATVLGVLTAIGMQPSEAAAEPGLVPAPIKRAVARQGLDGFLTGAPLGSGWRGFGLLGGAGAGKTMCLASMVGLRIGGMVRTAIEAVEDDRDWTDPPPGILSRVAWVNWPQASGAMKSLAVEPGGMHDIEYRARRWMAVELLVVDDIGRERIKGGYEDDFAHGYLDRVIDERSRARRAILWTSNLTHAALVKRYGEAFTSRLLGLAPLVELPALPDKRLTI